MWEKFKKTPLGNFLKRAVKFVLRKLKRLKYKLFKKLRYENLITALETYFVDEKDTAYQAVKTEELIDVIIPIFNGYDYLLRLFRDLPKTSLKCRFILVDDQSTDKKVRQLEEEFVKEHENAILLINEKNYGFVKSVNRGLAEAKGHVALVNTDTELPEGWLERLMAPILMNDKIASTTPYTNSGTICSFPNFGVNNAIYRKCDVDTLDSYFRKVKPKYVEMPTGVGFCMGMSKYALEKVGTLDYETYGRGFGEENDWCQRAIKQGFQNVQVENLFVYHKHGGTFLSEEKAKLLEEHMNQLKKKFPSYDRQVSAFCRKDPNRKLRNLLRVFIDTHEMKSVLYFDHSLGGGATSYLDARKEEFLNADCCVSVIRYQVDRNNYRFYFESGDEHLEYEFSTPEDLLAIGKWLHFDEIYINELVFYPRIWDTQDIIATLAKKQNAKLVMLFHDFFAICPTVNLLGADQKFCGALEGDACQQCFAKHNFKEHYHCENRKEWLERWGNFLKQCTEVRTFSEDTLQRVKQAFGENLAYTVVPHQVEYAFPIYKDCKTTDTLNIGILGALASHKGSDFVEEILKEIEAKKLNIRVKLIGYTSGVSLKKYSCYEQTGPYKPWELPKLIYEKDIDIFLIASVWPETFSYTTEEVMKMGMPIAALDMGAPAERVRKYEKGLILKKADAEEALAQIKQFMEEKCKGAMRRVECKKKIIFIAEYISFSSRYRMEHLREELLYQGYPSEVWETKHITNHMERIKWKEIGLIVIYRCRCMPPVSHIYAAAWEQRIPVVYDIDDYIFKYEDIEQFTFFEDDDYGDFHLYSDLIQIAMKKSDRIIVSTDNLKKAVKDMFPEKETYVNRNVASAEMLILSALAMRKKRTVKEDVVLGYFSGSHTHSGDFDIICEPLLSILKRYPQTYLKIVGCLELPKEFDPYADRIIREGFMDWQKLPESIAKTDINLMPLEDTFFHRCKSENKWMEAALVKVPTVGTFNAEIAGATNPGEDILLCRTQKEWEENLAYLIEHPDARREIAEKAYEYVIHNKTTLCKDRALLEFIMREKVL